MMIKVNIFTHWHRASLNMFIPSDDDVIIARVALLMPHLIMPRKMWFGKCDRSTGIVIFNPCWHHQMETFSALLALCVGNSPVTGEFPTQRPVTRSFDVFYDLRLNEQLSKQSWGWGFETPSRPLCRHRNVVGYRYRFCSRRCSRPVL